MRWCWWLPAALVSGLTLPSGVRSDLPCPEPAQVTWEQPIEVAYVQIRMGMSEQELSRLMAPYKKVFTGHAQWPCWTDGRTTVYVTVWINPITGESPGVTDKELERERGR
jgi:hypothetical protein